MNQPVVRPGDEHCHWFILPLLLATPTMQFSLDRKRRSHKQNQCFVSDSVGLIFTKSYRSTLLITTPDYDSVASENQPLGCEGGISAISPMFAKNTHCQYVLAYALTLRWFKISTWMLRMEKDI